MTQLESSLSELTVQAEGGDAIAQYRLGVLLLLGECGKQDIEMAFWWLSRAAVAQHAGAQSLLPMVAAMQPHARVRGGIHAILHKIVWPVQAVAGFAASMLAGVSRVLPALRRGWQLGPTLAESVGEERQRRAPFVDAA